jgi:hypothetical protein
MNAQFAFPAPGRDDVATSRTIGLKLTGGLTFLLFFCKTECIALRMY